MKIGAHLFIRGFIYSRMDFEWMNRSNKLTMHYPLPRQAVCANLPVEGE